MPRKQPSLSFWTWWIGQRADDPVLEEALADHGFVDGRSAPLDVALVVEREVVVAVDIGPASEIDLAHGIPLGSPRELLRSAWGDPALVMATIDVYPKRDLDIVIAYTPDDRVRSLRVELHGAKAPAAEALPRTATPAPSR